MAHVATGAHRPSHSSSTGSMTQQHVAAIGIPIKMPEFDEEGNPVPVSPLRARFDESAHVWENKAFAQAELTCFLGTPLSLQESVADLRKRYPTNEHVSPMVFTTYNSPWKTTIMVPLTESASEAFQGTNDPHVKYLTGTWMSKMVDIPLASLNTLDYAVLAIPKWVKSKTGRKTSTTKDFYVGYSLEKDGTVVNSPAILFARIY